MIINRQRQEESHKKFFLNLCETEKALCRTGATDLGNNNKRAFEMYGEIKNDGFVGFFLE